MVTRRQLNLSAIAALGGVPALQACSQGVERYEETARSTWRHGKVDAGDSALLQRELVRYATLAPSSHNTQCWKFRLSGRAIDILPDLSRRCPAVDPDDHHLFVSLGCATENMVQAALANGLKADATFDSASDAIRVQMEPAQAVTSPLFQAIPERQCTRAEYDGKPLSKDELTLLQQAGSGNGVQLLLLTERPKMEQVLEYVVQGNTAQMNDPAFVAELKAWIRFNGSDAVRLSDGLFGASSGNPTLPSWLGPWIFNFVFTPKSENDKYAKHVRSSAGIAVFVGPSNDKAGWIETGRAYERFALQATALGVRTAHLNQPIEVASLRPSFANLLGLSGKRPDLVIRFGHGPTLPPSLRRPVQAVLV